MTLYTFVGVVVFCVVFHYFIYFYLCVFFMFAFLCVCVDFLMDGYVFF